MVTSNTETLLELETEITELERKILDRATQDRLLAIPKQLFTEAQGYHRRGNTQEARLIINCVCRLLERAKNEFKKQNPHLQVNERNHSESVSVRLIA